MIGGDEDVFVLKFYGESQFAADLFEVGLHHLDIPMDGHFNLADHNEIVAVSIAVEIDDIDVLAGQILAESPHDARLIVAECSNHEAVGFFLLNGMFWRLDGSDEHLELPAGRFGGFDLFDQRFGGNRLWHTDDHNEREVAAQDGFDCKRRYCHAASQSRR